MSVDILTQENEGRGSSTAFLYRNAFSTSSEYTNALPWLARNWFRRPKTTSLMIGTQGRASQNDEYLEATADLPLDCQCVSCARRRASVLTDVSSDEDDEEKIRESLSDGI